MDSKPDRLRRSVSARESSHHSSNESSLSAGPWLLFLLERGPMVGAIFLPMGCGCGSGSGCVEISVEKRGSLLAMEVIMR